MIHAREDYNRIQDPSGKIPEDEPVFLIRGQDLAAFAAINSWIAAAEILGVDAAMVDRVKAHVVLIRQWQIEHGSKVPDL